MEDNSGYRRNYFSGEEKPLYNSWSDQEPSPGVRLVCQSQQAEKTYPEGIQRVHCKTETTGEPQKREDQSSLPNNMTADRSSRMESDLFQAILSAHIQPDASELSGRCFLVQVTSRTLQKQPKSVLIDNGHANHLT